MVSTEAPQAATCPVNRAPFVPAPVAPSGAAGVVSLLLAAGSAPSAPANAEILEAFGLGPTMPDVVLDAEKLRVYHLALDLQVMASALVPSLHRVLRDQFERASLSVVLNIAEGSGRHSRRQKRYHYGVARGSATECAAMSDVLRLRRLAPPNECDRVRRLAVRITQMLTKLDASLSKGETKTESKEAAA